MAAAPVNPQSRYIAIEGPDGAGKSAQMKLLVSAFMAAELPYINIREPGATDVGQELRKILLTGHADKLNGMTEALLFSADRRHTILTMVRPALAEGKWVLCDRTFLTTLAYQGYGRGLPLDVLRELTRIAVEDTVPDVQLILDLPPEIGLQRKGVQAQLGLTETRMESIGDEFHRRNYAGYKKEAAENPEKYILIDATGTIAEVHSLIIGELNRRFGLKLTPQT